MVLTQKDTTMKKIILLITLAMTSLAQAAEITVHKYTDSNKKYISFTGEIIETDLNKLKRITKANPTAKTIHFNSQGGLIYTAWDIAEFIHEQNLNTAVSPDKECLSACTMAYMGGIDRYITEKSTFAYHPAHTATYNTEATLGDIFTDGQQEGFTAAYNYIYYIKDPTKAIKALRMIASAYREVTHNEFHYVTADELIEVGIATYKY